MLYWNNLHKSNAYKFPHCTTGLQSLNSESACERTLTRFFQRYKTKTCKGVDTCNTALLMFGNAVSLPFSVTMSCHLQWIELWVSLFLFTFQMAFDNLNQMELNREHLQISSTSWVSSQRNMREREKDKQELNHRSLT